jgi:glutamate 5-kinase
MKKPILILKAGTASITRADGTPDMEVMQEIVRQVAELHPAWRVLLVSSGAVGAGKRFLKSYSGQIAERKAAAAIGNPVLIAEYARLFQPAGLQVAQMLCERQHFARRESFLQLRETLGLLWEQDVVPIANENDVVSSRELKFSDNDELATLLAVGLGAGKLLLGTSVAGLLRPDGSLVQEIPQMGGEHFAWVRAEAGGPGLGGMSSKLTFARLATRMGIETHIFGIRQPGAILDALQGKAGTRCFARPAPMPARSKWMASSGVVIGQIKVDRGAQAALLKRSSLLAVGVRSIEAAFERGEVIELADEVGQAFAVARARVSAAELSKHLRARNYLVAHADEIVLL